MPIRRKTPVPMTAAELALLDTFEDRLLDWIEAGKGPFVIAKSDHPGTPEVVWSELARSARNGGWTVIVNDTMVAIEAQQSDG
jgi:hypothetical protein